jgi:histidinol-phosphatase (PHP family)
MICWNAHAHTTTSDGDLSAPELIRKAAGEGLCGLTITDHYPYPFSPNDRSSWEKGLEIFQRHLENLGELQENVMGIELLKGIEIEFVDPPQALEGYLRRLELDFVLGGVHAVDGWIVDWSDEVFQRAEQAFGSFIVAIQKYFQAVGDMAESGLVDSLAHPDLVKKYNPQSRYFNEEVTWYREAVEQCLERVARSGVALEVNTGGLRGPVKDLYPSRWILSRARELGIPATVGTDFHRSSGQVGAGLEAAGAALRAAGYDSYLLFRKRKPEKINII